MPYRDKRLFFGDFFYCVFAACEDPVAGFGVDGCEGDLTYFTPAEVDFGEFAVDIVYFPGNRDTHF